MDNKIIPVVWEEDWEDVVSKLRQLDGLADRVSFDIMDGRFVRKYAWDDPEKLKTIKFDYEYDGHLFLKEPEDDFMDWVKGGLGRFYFHYEAMEGKPELEDDYGRELEAIEHLIREIRSYKRDVGIALLPDQDWQPIIDYIRKVDVVLLLTAKSWIKRRRFLDQSLEEIKSLRKYYEDLDIAVRGCINEDNIEEVKEAGANLFYVNDYIWESDDPKEAYKTLEDLVTEEEEED